METRTLQVNPEDAGARLDAWLACRLPDVTRSAAARLCGEGRIRKVSVEGMPDRYDRAARHDHLVCRGCGKLADVTLEDLTQQLERQVGVQILDYDLKLVYLCDACRRKEKESKGGTI